MLTSTQRNRLYLLRGKYHRKLITMHTLITVYFVLSIRSVCQQVAAVINSMPSCKFQPLLTSEQILSWENCGGKVAVVVYRTQSSSSAE